MERGESCSPGQDLCEFSTVYTLSVHSLTIAGERPKPFVLLQEGEVKEKPINRSV